MSDVLFYTLAAVLVVGAIAVVTARNLYRAAYALAGVLAATAVLYLALTAPLVAAVQILLYTGGVLTLVVFALVITAETHDPAPWRRPIPAALLAALVCTLLVSVFSGVEGGTTGGLEDGQAAGVDLFTRYLVPFELLSVLLLGAIFGALAIARRDPEGPA